MPSGGWLVTPHRDKSHTWVSEEENAGLLSSDDNQDTWWSLIILSGTYIQTWGIWLPLCIGDFLLNFYKFSDSPKTLIALKLSPLRYCITSFGAVIFHIKIKKNKTEQEHESTWILFNLKSCSEDSLKTPEGNLGRMIHYAIFVWVLHVINHRGYKTTFKGWKIGQMIYSDGIKDGVIHTSLFLYLHAFIYMLVHTSLWLLGIVNEILCVKDIWDTLKCPISCSNYYRKQQSKVVKCIGFPNRPIGSRILALSLSGVNCFTSLHHGLLCWKIGIVIIQGLSEIMRKMHLEEFQECNEYSKKPQKTS